MGLNVGSDQRTTVDFWAFRTKSALPEIRLSLAHSMPEGLPLSFKSRRAGWQGYEESFDVLLADMHIGLVATGGDNQRGWSYASLTGRGCEWIDSIDEAHEHASGLVDYELRRVDIALTTKDRSVSHDDVVTAYRSGEFGTRGRSPDMKQILPEDPRAGRTVYVGSRERDKFFRAYEKGLELRAKSGGTLDAIGGVPVEDIYRLELELKPKTCPLPVDLVERRDQYFAGAYPYLQRVLHVEPEIMIIRRDRGPQLDMAAALENVRRQYGTTLFTALTAHHGDFGAVWSKICAERHNDALLAAGVLNVDH
jgi:phage replication initiation protein